MIAYCSSCGSKTATRLVARQSLSVCPGCDRIFFRNPKVVVTSLIEDQGRVLLVLRDIEPGRGLWGLPGGFVDWDEHPEVAMVRECREEMLITAEPIELLAVQHVIHDDEGIDQVVTGGGFSQGAPSGSVGHHRDVGVPQLDL